MTVIGGGIVSYLVLRELLGLTPARIAALGGCFIAAGLLFGMLLEGWLGNLSPTVERAALLLATLALAALLAVGLQALATRAMHLTQSTADDWVGHATLNALATAIILHVAIGRRWPFPHPAAQAPRTSSSGASGSVDVEGVAGGEAVVRAAVGVEEPARHHAEADRAEQGVVDADVCSALTARA